MIAILTSYWLQTVALVAAFGLLAVKMACKSTDTNVDAVAGGLILFALGSGAAKATSERKAARAQGGDPDVPQ